MNGHDRRKFDELWKWVEVGRLTVSRVRESVEVHILMSESMRLVRGRSTDYRDQSSMDIDGIQQ